MITTVTLNAAIDKTYVLPSFELGKVSRATSVHADAGGKGLNVARVAHTLGQPVTATGFVGGNNGQFICNELDKQGIPHQFVTVNEESRLCLNIIDTSSKAATELLEPGPVITPDQLEEMKHKVSELAAISKIVAFSGSIPKGVPTTFYAELITIAKERGAIVFLDTSGEALLEGIKARPHLIKPNEVEVEKLIGKKLEQESDLYDSVHKLMESGIQTVVVSLGASGSLVGSEGQLYRVKAPKLDPVSTVGCGDSFVGGMAVAIMQGKSLADCLKLATAAGSANALTERAGVIRLEDVNRFFEIAEITPL